MRVQDHPLFGVEDILRGDHATMYRIFDRDGRNICAVVERENDVEILKDGREKVMQWADEVAP